MSKTEVGLYEGFDDDGFEGIDGSDLKIPFLRVLQSNSPMVENQEARAGEIVNSVTKEVVDELVFQPARIQHAFVEWRPRNLGGGFVGQHEKGDKYVRDCLKAHQEKTGTTVGKIETENDTELVETYYVFGQILSDDGTEVEGFGVIAFSSTQIPIWKSWLTAMRLIKGKPPLFANRARLSSEKTSNDKGTFWNWVIKPFDANWLASLIDQRPLLEAATDLAKGIDLGTAAPAMEHQEQDDDDVPF